MIRRNYIIDIARAISIVLVVVYHYVPDNAPAWHRIFNDILLTIRMPLFLFISGYIYMYYNKKKNYKLFIITKFKRLMIPYFVVSVIIITIKLLCGNDKSVDLYSYIEMFYRPVAGYFLWFIWVLFILFLIMPLFRSKTSRLMLFLISLYMSFVSIDVTDLFCIKQLKYYSMYFICGAVWCDYKDILSKLYKIPGVIVLLLFVLFQFIYNKLNGETFFASIIFKMLLPILGVAIIFYISNLLNGNSNIRKYIIEFSNKSYVIYLFHTTFMGLIKMIIQKIPYLVNPDYVFGYSLGVFIVVLSGLIGPIYLYDILKHNKVTRFLFGLKV